MIILIDNYDSFTFNLFQLLGQLAQPGTPIEVVRNDAVSAAELQARRPRHVILSPGPGHPTASRLSLEASDLFPDTPLLGVCLGHQALAVAHGGRVVRSPRPTHGQPVAVQHDGSALFRGLPSPIDAALYHSLVVDRPSLPGALAVCAWTGAGDIMALRHRSRPHHGVQFHPESFMTRWGAHLVGNFLRS